MTTLGQLALLIAFVGSGYAAFASLAGWQVGHRVLRASALWAFLVAAAALTATTALLAWALVTCDFRFEYVLQYAGKLLPWYYRLSALWVGQAGSLLAWAWFLAVLAAAFRFWPRREASELREPAFGVLMAYLCFLVAVMVFSADPMQPSVAFAADGNGMSPELQHPAMLAHPPIVFLGYAAWSIPFALAVASLAGGRLDAAWAQESRPWALFAWVVLGVGILWGAEWAYEELGWGGYWAWDPIENGSLIPWLTGTALVHCLMSWRHVGALKKTAMALAIATFGLCNFATFLTRSGIFSSLHAFSQSPIGWMFLAQMVVLAVGGGVLIVRRRALLTPQRPISSVLSREAFVLLSTMAILLLATVMLVGTILGPLSSFLPGPKITVGEAFYNNVLIPTGLVLLAATAVAPLLRWGAGPTATEKKLLLVSLGTAGVVTALVFAMGVRHPIALGIAGLVVTAIASAVGAIAIDSARRTSERLWLRPLRALADGRRRYAGFLVHLAFFSLAVGVAGSSLGSRQDEFVMAKGQTIEWAGRSVRYVDLIERDMPDKLVMAARLEIGEAGAAPYTLTPAQQLHRPQNQWATEVAIHSDWRGDFYTILHGGRPDERISLTLIENPLMRWLWLAGWLSVAGAILGLWPSRRRVPGASTVSAESRTVLRGPHRPVATPHRNPSHG
ncbi:MAG: heme lyase CcmF/NrfE family subunit [Pirellulales bacterium]